MIDKIRKKMTVVVFCAILLISCGGVIGNIEQYSFNTFSGRLKQAMNLVYLNHTELQKTDTTMYGMNNGEDFYYVLTIDEVKYVFRCHVVGYQTMNSGVDLSLTTATEWGNVMRLAPNMGFFEKRKYRKLFEENILPKIKEGLSHSE